MTCIRCDGLLCQERMYDLPRSVREYYCVNCGERFWIDVKTLTFEMRPLAACHPWGVHPN